MTARQSAEVLRALGTSSPEGVPEEAPTAPDPSVRPTERALRLGTLAVLGAALALLTGQAWLLAPAAVPLVLLVLSLPRRGEGLRRLRGEAEVPSRRVFEGEPVTARVDLSFAGVSGWIDPGVTPARAWN
ncbi:hypothetical protein ACFQZC_28040 [Streptacidiphilus monticola]